ncbi:MFS transporter [Longimicrobium terrae]|uniref:ACS family hexuronate transporter-like MFS transporter n=1 Tax=Longimicrobium terrae TaxID=1639882 RepID=A0A841GUL7_9BACT|nr:MFS transporter [Longimicrobium terrae]MBB4634002.1 ACS family hexuronate transporter-like MFS transporter [Longimicrobium terrae]MBB6069108.1 ACS family hexuronate transporter-like MFS transporter [Longimicrobium terrae]NNC28282.1 MFS transporter [Longimicrobium terrae]
MSATDQRVAGERAAAASAEAATAAWAATPGAGYRWTICALLFFATTINYIDRQVLGILAPTLTKELGWSEAAYGDIVSTFSFAYGVGFLVMGRLMDRIGVRKGYAFSIVAWSLAAMSHALAGSTAGFSWARGALGLGESGNFPGAIKATAEWFPKKERALATGIFNAGSNVGAIVAPIMVPWITLVWGWREAFIVTGALGFLWLAAWLIVYRSPEQHPRVSSQELAYIRSDPAEATTAVPWLSLLRHRQTWAFFLAKFLTDPIWWFYLYWLPKFLDARFGVQLGKIALPLVVIYVVADVGSVGGGWLSSNLIKRGWTVNAGRKAALLVAALLIVPTMFAPRAETLWVAVGIVSVAAAAHQWWSANLFTTASDMFPRRAVASVVGIGGFAGAMGGFLFQRLTGRILDATGNNYSIIFVMCGLAYVTALLIMHLMVPRLTPANLDGD